MLSSEAQKLQSLKDFGYGFNANGQLRQLDAETGAITDVEFKFVDQKHYEALGETITEHVYDLLVENGLHRICLADPGAAFFFSTQKELKNVDKLMIIIHGSGVVRAGQWARSLIINHSLDAGTIFPYIKRAKADGYEVIVTNGNDNSRDRKPIPGSKSPEDHAITVWQKIVQPSNAKSIAIVAHSYGGHVAFKLSEKFDEDFKKKVFAVALTDGVQGSSGKDSRLTQIATNFVSSSKPLGEPERSYGGDMPRVSAGHPKHEMTSYACIDAVFEFLAKRYRLERESAGSSSPENKKQKTDEL